LTQQAGLVVLDDQDMVGGLVGDQELGVVALGVHGILCRGCRYAEVGVVGGGVRVSVPGRSA
jgi:hypothetical protein